MSYDKFADEPSFYEAESKPNLIMQGVGRVFDFFITNDLTYGHNKYK